MVVAGVVVAALAGCSDGEARKLEAANAELQKTTETLSRENADLKRQLEAVTQDQKRLEQSVAELSVTAPMLLKQAVDAVSGGDAARAEKIVSTLGSRFPGTSEHKSATVALEALRTRDKEKQKEASRLAALGFKALKIETLDTGSVKGGVGIPRAGNQFAFDRYNDTFHYFDADRDNKYVMASLLLTAGKGITNPDLPGIALYFAEGDQLRKLGNFKMRFASWSDYATYLGNYPDSRNDFAKTATVKFEVGVEVPASDAAKRPLYVVATKVGCLQRHEARFSQPPVSYVGTCGGLAASLSLEDFSGPESRIALIRRVD